MNTLYTNSEILDQLEDLERRLLERAYGSSYGDDLRTYDLVNYLGDKARELDLNECGVYAMLMHDLERLSAEIGTRRAGARGEQMAAKSLACLRNDVIDIPTIALQNGNTFEEYDQIVISSAGVYVIEVKNYSQDSIIEEDGVLRCGSTIRYNVGERMLQKRRALWDAISTSAESFMSEEDIHCMLLFVNDKTKVTDRFHRIPVKRRGQIVYDIKSACLGSQLLSWEQMKRIKASIITRKVEATFSMPTYSDALIDELEVVLELIERKSSDVAEVESRELEVERIEVASSFWKSRAIKWLPVAASLVLGMASANELFKHIRIDFK